MTTLAINNPIFSNLFNNPAINQVALRRFVSIANSNPVLNAALSQAASEETGKVKIRLATIEELRDLGAGAFFKYDAVEIRDTEGFMSVAIDPAWLIGPNANFAAINVGRTNLPGIIAHEFDHYLRVGAFRATDDFLDPSKTFPNLTSEQRFEAYATGRMQVEVLGWYTSMKANQFARTGTENGAFSPLDLMAIGEVERELYRVELRGIQAGLAGDSLQKYVADNGAPILSKSQAYWDSYVGDYAANMNPTDLNYQAVRSRVAYKLETPEDVVGWQEAGGGLVVTYRNGTVRTSIDNPDGTGSDELRDSGGNLLGKVVTSLSGTIFQTETFGANNQLQSTTTTQTYDDGTSLTTTRC